MTAESLPAADQGVFSLVTLAEFDGSARPCYVGVCGKVVDCSSSENFSEGRGYGALWSGRDATYALAKLSLEAKDANRLDFKLDDFSEDERKALAGWYKHFTTKYPVVGTLQEYDGWDFTEIEQASAAETPFGLGAAEESEENEPEGTAAKAAKEAASETTAAPRDAFEEAVKGGAVVFSAGDRVAVKGLESKPELNGRIGTLQKFVPDKGRFAVILDAEGGNGYSGTGLLLKPGNIAKAEEETGRRQIRSF
eukprot:TRINITY_DN82036_c0_g1_i1.p1 TRINITY_DN82036_c0_g1~~TRINITY_DN82036_c0_g1_i1.p1  ORF type:complete len:252 (+),score=71.34 TRINITY_DN82036_c0_g1_i1:73-828(+)